MIHAKDVRMQFGEREVLKGITLDLPKGCIFGLLGPSGAGKTTIIKLITGQLRATAGTIDVFGKPVAELSGTDRTKFGIMMDQFGVYERFNCYENLKIFAQIQNVSDAQIKAALESVGLLDAIRTPAHKLSKGMRNRLQLARVLTANPQIIFLDEPTSGLDPASTEQIHQLILEKKNMGCTIFLTTHNMAEAYKLCDTVALLNEGRIVESGAPEEICRKYNHQKGYVVRLKDGEVWNIQNGDAASLDKLCGYLKSDQVETIHSTEPDLETVFMELTGNLLDR